MSSAILPNQELLPHLFRSEFSRIVAVLCKSFGFHQMEIAEDIAGDTFLQASEVWPYKGIPENPVAWLYAVAKNKAINHLQREKIFQQKIAPVLNAELPPITDENIDLSEGNISDSLLQMIFAVCHPSIPPPSQIALALRILCGFGIDEIATAFYVSPETISKRIFRAKEKLRTASVQLQFPGNNEMDARLNNVLTTLYLLFSEGYYSENNDQIIRKDLCDEAIRLTILLTENNFTAQPEVFALLSMMYFHSSRLDARAAGNTIILYDDQDLTQWDADRIAAGAFWLQRASTGNKLSKYHLEAAIAWHQTMRENSPEKWKNLLFLYDQLLAIQFSPPAALSRIYVLSKLFGNQAAIDEAEQLIVEHDHFYFALMGELFSAQDKTMAAVYYNKAIELSRSSAEKEMLKRKMELLN